MTECLLCTMHRVCVIFLTLTPSLSKPSYRLTLLCRFFFFFKNDGLREFERFVQSQTENRNDAVKAASRAINFKTIDGGYWMGECAQQSE